MACAKPSNCAPCSKCPDSPEPVMPRCNVVLLDGSYTNATVVVEDGCIVAIEEGTPLLYQPDNSCSGTTGGETGEGLQGDPGPSGDNATIEIGTVTSLAPGSVATVENVGTDTHAILNIGIPRGEPGAAAELPTGGATTNAGGMLYANGQLMNPLPAAWPPLLDILPPTITGAGVLMTFTKRADALVEVALDVSGLITWVENEIAALVGTIDTQAAALAALTARVDALEAAP